ncbi:LytR family transcriptional regulator [Haloechinothrix sp. LS1_15]|nr:LytR family transcriptional regulator [Haloechinothrix sp. LS1_15]
MSLLILGVTGYAWASVLGMDRSLTVADVLTDGGGDDFADGSRDILLVGLDSRTDAQGNELPREYLNELNVGTGDGELNTDTIILIHVPEDGSGAVAASIPRDSYVTIPGFGRHKINSAFARGKVAEQRRLRAEEGLTDPREIEVRARQEGARTLIRSVERLTGRTIDNYASVNIFGFLEITEAIGGVEVCLNEAVQEDNSGADFDAGVQTLSGKDALAFVRQRYGLPRGDLDRVVRQQAFLAGLASNILSAGTLTNRTKLNDLIDAVGSSVVLDQGWDIMGFAEQMGGLSGGDIEFRTIPVERMNMDTPAGSAVQVDPATVRQFFDEYSGTDTAEGSEEDASDEITPAEVTVNVLNTTTRPGLAADVAGSLTAQGFTEGLVDNAAARDTTVVRYPAGEEGNARHVVAALDGAGELEEDGSLSTGQVTILLGSDFPAGTGTEGTGPSPQHAPTEGPTEQADVHSGQEDTPDGAGDSAGDAERDEDADEGPITADGVTCVN